MQVERRVVGVSGARLWPSKAQGGRTKARRRQCLKCQLSTTKEQARLLKRISDTARIINSLGIVQHRIVNWESDCTRPVFVGDASVSSILLGRGGGSEVGGGDEMGAQVLVTGVARAARGPLGVTPSNKRSRILEPSMAVGLLAIDLPPRTSRLRHAALVRYKEEKRFHIMQDGPMYNCLQECPMMSAARRERNGESGRQVWVLLSGCGVDTGGIGNGGSCDRRGSKRLLPAAFANEAVSRLGSSSPTGSLSSVTWAWRD